MSNKSERHRQKCAPRVQDDALVVHANGGRPVHADDDHRVQRKGDLEAQRRGDPEALENINLDQR